MLVTAVSAWLPTRSAPSRGSFVVRDLQAISAHHDIRVIHLVPPQDDDGTRKARVDGMDVLRIPMAPTRPGSVLSAARALRASLRGSDMVHTMAFPSLLPLSVPALSPVPTSAGWVHTEHWSALTTPHTLPAHQRRLVGQVSRLLRGPQRVTAVCEFLARPVRDVRGPAPVDVVPCIVDPHPLTPRRPRESGQLRLVSTGGLIERKDPLIAVRTVAALVERGLDVTLDWVGQGPLASATSALSEELGVADRITLVGSLDTAGVRAELGKADMFFGPTRADNFFVSAAEAIAAGRPVVLGSTGGQGEYVDSSIGELVPEQDVELYADAIEDVDRRTASLSSEEIAATIGDRFSSAVVGRGYAEVYDRVSSSAP